MSQYDTNRAGKMRAAPAHVCHASAGSGVRSLCGWDPPRHVHEGAHDCIYRKHKKVGLRSLRQNVATEETEIATVSWRNFNFRSETRSYGMLRNSILPIAGIVCGLPITVAWAAFLGIELFHMREWAWQRSFGTPAAPAVDIRSMSVGGDDLRLLQAVEDLLVQTLVTKLRCDMPASRYATGAALPCDINTSI